MPIDSTLLKTQKNDVFVILRKADLNPDEFRWETKKHVRYDCGMTEYTISVITHVPTGYHCEFLSSGGLSYSPGEDQAVDFRQVVGDWHDVTNSLVKWISCLRRELDAPDLWRTIAQERKLAEVAVSGTLGNEKFSPEEQRYISQQLNEIKAFLLTTNRLQLEAARIVEDRFDYLEGASQRLGRKDWLNLTIGVLFSIIIAVALPPDAAKELLRMAGVAFQSLFHAVLRLAES